jgi:hypothetical protein
MEKVVSFKGLAINLQTTILSLILQLSYFYIFRIFEH